MPNIIIGKKGVFGNGFFNPDTGSVGEISLFDDPSLILRAEATLSTETIVDVSDQSDLNGINSFSTVETEFGPSPAFKPNFFGNGVSAFEFDNNGLNIVTNSNVASSIDANGRTYAIAFRTGSNTTDTQVIYEEGGSNDGISITIDSGELRAFSYGSGSSTYTSTSISADTDYVLAFDCESSTDQQRLWLNGSGVVSTITKAPAGNHADNLGIGAVSASTGDAFLPGIGNTGSTPYYGKGLHVGEIICYDDKLSDAETEQLMNYLSNKYHETEYYPARSTTRPTSVDTLIWFPFDEADIFFDRPSKDQSIDFWPEISLDGIDITASDLQGTAPQYVTSASSNGLPMLKFNNGRFSPSDNFNDTTDQRVYVLAFKTGSDVTSDQIILEEGGGNQGTCFAIINGEFRAHGYTGSSSTNYISHPVSANTEYVFTVTWDANSASSTQNLYYNGSRVDFTTSKSIPGSWSDTPGIGGLASSNVFPGGGNSGDSYAQDIEIAAICIYNQVLTTTERQQATNYFANRYFGQTPNSGVNTGTFPKRTDVYRLYDAEKSYFKVDDVIYNVADGNTTTATDLVLFDPVPVVSGASGGFWDVIGSSGFDTSNFTTGGVLRNSSNNRTWVFAFRTGTDVTTRQTIWDEGGNTDGCTVGIVNGEFRALTYDTNVDNPYVFDTVQPNTNYVFGVRLTGGSTLELYYEDQQVDVTNSAQSKGSASNDAGFLFINGGNLTWPGEGDQVSGPDAFLGRMGAAIVYDSSLSNSDFIDVMDYAWRKYYNTTIV
jgi:hypothetical protein